MTIYTIGYSNMRIEKFLTVLKAHSITQLVDVRTIPRSRQNPSFDISNLPGYLNSAGIKYISMKELGGLRHPLPESRNTGWRNMSFRGFADYMGTEEFSNGLSKLIELSKMETVVMMCAEGNPYRCHRSLIADALTVRGIEVVHISGPGPGKTHRLTPFAKVDGYRITYPEL